MITTINFALTTHCDRLCSECCCNIPNITREHYSWEYIENAAKYLKGVDRINLTGGEPTLHPDFVKFVPKLKELFNCRLFTIESNGYGFRKFPEVFKHFDCIQVSHYTKESYENSYDNISDVEYANEYFKEITKVIVGEVKHTVRSTRSGNKCDRGGYETVSYFGGLLYPCCVAPGIPTAKGIVLTDNWREEIMNQKPPCDECFFYGGV